MKIDASDLDGLAGDMFAALAKAPAEVAAVVERGAINIKKDWRQRWSGHPHIKFLPGAIDYDMARTPTRVEAEIGPDQQSAQGPLAPFIEDGSPTSAGAPIPGGRPAADAEQPRLEAALVALADRLLGR